MKELTSTNLSRAAALTLGVLSFGAHQAVAHLTYSGRNFGTFGASPRSATISNISSKANGWADGTDADWAVQDNQRYFEFVLSDPATVTFSVTSLVPATFYPAFTIFSGLGHSATDPAHPDYDGSTTTQAYLASLPAPARKGSFDALGNLTIGNDNDPANNYVGSLVTLLYQGSAADGTAANYGPASGINGDGLLDGNLTASFALPAGAYTLAVSGADYYSASASNYGFNTTLSVVPEPGAGAMLITAAAACGLLVRRKRPA